MLIRLTEVRIITPDGANAGDLSRSERSESGLDEPAGSRLLHHHHHPEERSGAALFKALNTKTASMSPRQPAAGFL